jgi:hypothetical protein
MVGRPEAPIEGRMTTNVAFVQMLLLMDTANIGTDAFFSSCQKGSPWTSRETPIAPSLALMSNISGAASSSDSVMDLFVGGPRISGQIL